MGYKERKNPRLTEFDYSSCGAYFVTLCTYHRCKNLSRVRRDDPCGRPTVSLLPLGRLAKDAFDEVEQMYSVRFDYRMIMPDHIHFIAWLPGDHSVELGRVVGAYKSIIANRWLKVCKAEGRQMGKIWQERFYEHVIRNEEDLRLTRQYIEGNPYRWLEKETDRS